MRYRTAETLLHELICLSLLLLGLASRSLAGEGKKDVHQPLAAVVHTVRGKVIALGGSPLSTVRVQLAGSGGTVLGQVILSYDGSFVFESVSPGSYRLTIERQDAATIGRALEIKPYPTPKTILLEIQLNNEAASIRELVTEVPRKEAQPRVEAPTQVSKKALKAFQQAVAESERGNSQRAIAHLETAVREQPNYFEAYNNLGVQHRKLRQWDEAIRAFRRALELRTDSAKPHVNLGVIYGELGQTKEAITSFETARRLEPNSTAIHIALGQLYFQKQDYLNAEESLETATRLNPAEARQAFLLLVEIALRHQDKQRGRQYLQIMKEYFPADPDAIRLSDFLETSQP